MPRETKEQRAEREAKEREAAALELAEFKNSVPARMKQMQDDAKALGMSVDVTLADFGPILHLRHPYTEGGTFDETVSAMTEQWEFEYTERRVREFKEEAEAAARRLDLAREVWTRLGGDERRAVKEYIHRLEK